jgi:hypothetical protein
VFWQADTSLRSGLDAFYACLTEGELRSADHGWEAAFALRGVVGATDLWTGGGEQPRVAVACCGERRLRRAARSHQARRDSAASRRVLVDEATEQLRPS